MNLTITLVFLVLTSTVRSLNILGIFPYHGTSHFLVFRVYLRELANRGHNVTVISHFPEKNPPANYQDISLAGTIEVLKDDMPVEKSYTSIINTALFLTFTGKENCEVMVKNKQVQDLVHSKAKFDVVVVEQFNSDCAFGIAYKLKAPVVGMMSHILMPWHYQRLGIPYNTAYVPFHFLEGGTKPSLYQRVERVLFDVYFRTLYYFVTQRSDQNTLARYFDEIPPLDQLAGEMKFLLTLKKFVDEAKHGVIYISFGSVISPSSLSHERTLKKFVDEAKHGVIYISFGSVISPSSLSHERESQFHGFDSGACKQVLESYGASVRCLAYRGRFLEIGKFDISNNTPIGMYFFLKETSFHGIMLDYIFDQSFDFRLAYDWLDADYVANKMRISVAVRRSVQAKLARREEAGWLWRRLIVVLLASLRLRLVLLGGLVRLRVQAAVLCLLHARVDVVSSVLLLRLGLILRLRLRLVLRLGLHGRRAARSLRKALAPPPRPVSRAHSGPRHAACAAT
ncbi:hypothetical protein MSG28_004706 [Choristoneura fumiferana]|uniref:Uncharacterized protein n=1 Tax=Choristoneura fumiferana TaxID=7141 RepID=A0ACC0K7A2_CHOFU|nr:hypothetical protein MSG28_004706 [Choristoneura fumiferana]